MHAPNQFDLLKQRRFAPFFWTQFLAAANDNILKNAFVVFVTYGALTRSGVDAGTVVNLIGAIFIAPFVIFSATSGQLADKYEKSKLIRLIKLLEIAIMLIGLAGFWLANLWLLFLSLALLGVHSTLFGPIKYAILPQHLRTEELVGGNGLVEMGTFVAILLGTIAGGGLVLLARGPLLVAGTGLAVGSIGLATAYFIPPAPPGSSAHSIQFNHVIVDEHALIYAVDRVNGGLYILKYTGKQPLD